MVQNQHRTLRLLLIAAAVLFAAILLSALFLWPTYLDAAKSFTAGQLLVLGGVIFLVSEAYLLGNPNESYFSPKTFGWIGVVLLGLGMFKCFEAFQLYMQ